MQTVDSTTVELFKPNICFPERLILRNFTLFILQAFGVYYLHLMKAKGLHWGHTTPYLLNQDAFRPHGEIQVLLLIIELIIRKVLNIHSVLMNLIKAVIGEPYSCLRLAMPSSLFPKEALCST